jgi:hypothetical protein
VAASAILALAIYCALYAIDFSSGHPFAAALGMSILAAIAAAGAAIALVFSLFAIAWCRPRRTAAMALLASVALPIVAVVGSVTFGVRALESHVSHNVSSMTGAAIRLVDVFADWGLPVEPIQQVARAVEGPGG